jgi:hypothetical protein
MRAGITQMGHGPSGFASQRDGDGAQDEPLLDGVVDGDGEG